MRGKTIAMAVMIAGGTAFPAMAQHESCLNEIQRLETAFAQGGEGGDGAGRRWFGRRNDAQCRQGAKPSDRPRGHFQGP